MDVTHILSVITGGLIGVGGSIVTSVVQARRERKNALGAEFRQSIEKWLESTSRLLSSLNESCATQTPTWPDQADAIIEEIECAALRVRLRDRRIDNCLSFQRAMNAIQASQKDLLAPPGNDYIEAASIAMSLRDALKAESTQYLDELRRLVASS